jgi:hypothetical protein
MIRILVERKQLRKGESNRFMDIGLSAEELITTAIRLSQASGSVK